MRCETINNEHNTYTVKDNEWGAYFCALHAAFLQADNRNYKKSSHLNDSIFLN